MCKRACKSAPNNRLHTDPRYALGGRARLASRFGCFASGVSLDAARAGEAERSAAALSPKKRGRLPAERPGGIRCFVVGAMHFNNHCTGLSTIVNGNCRAARPAPPPNKRMNPTLLFFELTNALRQRKSQTFHHSSARPARRVIRRAVRKLNGRNQGARRR